MKRVFDNSSAFAVVAAVLAAVLAPIPASARGKVDYHARVSEILGRGKPSAEQPAPSEPSAAADAAPAQVEKITESEKKNDIPRAQTQDDSPKENTESEARAKNGAPSALTVASALAERESGTREGAARAAKDLFALASGGNVAAQYALARACERGEGLKAPDPAQAVFWADRAAASGNRDAQILLGLYWAIGFGMDRDDAAARRAFLKAASSGDALGAALFLASGGEDQRAAELAPACTLGDLAPFASLAGCAGLLEKLFPPTLFVVGPTPGMPAVFRIGAPATQSISQ